MSKALKIIDLLNKIANGEKPKKIKFKGIEFVWQGINYRHFSEEECVYETLADYLSIENELNSTVEIIEEQEEIDIQNIVMMDLEKYGFDVKDEFAIDLICKINEIVQAVKQLDKKIKEK